jgi:pyruvate/2-oxoglutarate dehydrogenase complex dihydrolipoamide dehydrogenase (E3) component
MTKKQDLVVIGGGPGGLVVASVAAQVGLRVTLIEKSDRLGGDCLHSG